MKQRVNLHIIIEMHLKEKIKRNAPLKSSFYIIQKNSFFLFLLIIFIQLTGCRDTKEYPKSFATPTQKRNIQIDTFQYAMTTDSILLCSPVFDLSELHGETIEFIYTGLFDGKKLRKFFTPDPVFAQSRNIDFSVTDILKNCIL